MVIIKKKTVHSLADFHGGRHAEERGGGEVPHFGGEIWPPPKFELRNLGTPIFLPRNIHHVWISGRHAEECGGGEVLSGVGAGRRGCGVSLRYSLHFQPAYFTLSQQS